MRGRVKGLSALNTEVFRAHLEHWQTKLNLADWQVSLSPKRAAAGGMAEIEADLELRSAVVRIGREGWTDPTDHLIESTAVHELLHLLLAELVEFARDKDIPDAKLMAIEHRVVVVLEKLLVPKQDH